MIDFMNLTKEEALKLVKQALPKRIIQLNDEQSKEVWERIQSYGIQPTHEESSFHCVSSTYEMNGVEYEVCWELSDPTNKPYVTLYEDWDC